MVANRFKGYPLKRELPGGSLIYSSANIGTFYFSVNRYPSSKAKK